MTEQRIVNKHRAVIRGYGLDSDFADSPAQLIENIAQGHKVTGVPYFSTDEEATRLRLPLNPLYAPYLRDSKKAKTIGLSYVQKQLEKVIAQALAMAGLTESCLEGQSVRIYLLGHGMRADFSDYAGYQDRNDEEDLLFFPQIKQFCAASFAQDQLAHNLSKRYKLSWSPIPIFSASCSAMSAVHMANQAIQQGVARLALVVGWMQYTLQDIMSLGGQSLLTNSSPRPFSSEEGGGILPADGVMALVLQNEDDVPAQIGRQEVVLKSSASYQSSGSAGGNSFSADFRTIASTIESAMHQAGVTPDQVSCVFPHGNGVYASDKAEAMAILKIWGDKGVPIVTYKGQTGYFSVGSGLLDLMVADDAFMQQRVLPFTAEYELNTSLQLDFCTQRTPLPLSSGVILKNTMGLDGSVVACVLARRGE